MVEQRRPRPPGRSWPQATPAAAASWSAWLRQDNDGGGSPLANLLLLIRVRLEVVFSKYLGETASALGDVFAEAARVRGEVYLFDEFDAFGRTRLDDTEVGEIKRVVTTFLQLLDADHSDSVPVAATNTGHDLDTALFRRFDDVLELPAPTDEQRREMLARQLRPWRMKPTEAS